MLVEVLPISDTRDTYYWDIANAMFSPLRECVRALHVSQGCRGRGCSLVEADLQKGLGDVVLELNVLLVL